MGNLNASRWVAISGTSYEIDARHAGADWTRWRGGGLTQPIWCRLVIQGDRPRLVGLRLDEGQPITARQLREPRVGELEAAFGRYLRHHQGEIDGYEAHLDEQWEEADDLSDHERADLAISSASIRDMRTELGQWLDQLDVGEIRDLSKRGRGASPPTIGDLQNFARVYLEERLNAERGAKTRTGRRIGMNRSTVYRWIRLCQGQGLLPPQGVTA